jgi:hypothetical protein
MSEPTPRAAMALAKAAHFTVSIGEEDWYDLWHTHPDWEGDGNASLDARQPFLSALFTMLDRLRRQSASFAKPSQVWALVNEDDSANDAVYFHTRNPNADNFPVDFDFLDFQASVPAWLDAHVDHGIYRVGAALREGQMEYYILPREAACVTGKDRHGA